MADIVFIAHGLTSPLNASLALCHRLRADGHSVTFVSHADIDEVVRANGFSFIRLGDDARIRAQAEAQNRRNPWRWFRSMRQLRAQSAHSDEITRVVASLEPDLLIIDIEMHYAIIATASLKIRTILAMNWFTVFRRPGLPPPDSKIVPDGGPDDARVARHEWRAVRARATVARIRHKLGRGGVGDIVRPISYGTYHYADLKVVARARGYHLGEETDRGQWLRPYTYTSYPILCFNAWEMELPHEPPRNLRYAGPMVNLDRSEPRLSGEALARWTTWKERRASGGAHRPLIYCSLGSYWADVDFLKTVVDTFRRRADWDLILGLGQQVTADEFGDVPDNVILLEWAPQLEVLAHADVAINHAGVTSVNECILFGVPIVAYSPDLLDQDGVAARISFHGVGIAARWHTGDPQQLERHIQRVLGDGSFRSNAQAMGDEFRRYRDEKVAETLVRRYIDTGSLPG